MATLQLGSRRPDDAQTPAAIGLLARIRASRPVQTVLGVGAVLLLLILGGCLALLHELRAREIEDARRSLLNLNALLAETTSRTLENVDLVIRSVLEEMRENNVTTPNSLARLKTVRTFHDALKTRASGLSQLDALSVVDRNGHLVAYSRGFPSSEIDLSDREHFQRIREPATQEPMVSEPVQNRANGRWTVYLARRIVGPNGQFLGVVYGGINLDYFEQSWKRLLLNRGVSISIWRLDGMLLVRFPQSLDIGRRFESAALKSLTPANPSSISEMVSVLDRKPKVVALQVVQGLPLATAVVRSREQVLRQARQEAIVLLSAALLLAAAVIALTVALVRQFWAYEAVALAERERAVAVEGLGQLEDQLRQSQKLEVIGQLASGVAHDFNNLLTVVLGNLDRLSRRHGDKPDLVRYVDGARTGAERAAALSQRLLAFSRRQPLEIQRLDPNQTVTGLADLLRQSLGKKAVLEIELAEGLPAILVDRGGLESALLNLVVNARDAMPNGGTVTIRSHWGPPDPSGAAAPVCLTVADTGTGMAPEVARRAFEPFFTTKEAGVGTGLGLAQVADFVRRSEGNVAIDTAPGQGCRVTLSVPPAPAIRSKEEKDPV